MPVTTRIAHFPTETTTTTAAAAAAVVVPPMSVPVAAGGLSAEQAPDLLDLCSPIAPEHLSSFLVHPETILVDVRGEEVHSRAHLQGAVPLSIPSVLWRRFLKTRTAPGSLNRFLLSDVLAPLKTLSRDAVVILYDGDTTSPHTLAADAPLRVFAEYFAACKVNVLFLEGGFRAAKETQDSLVVAVPLGAHVHHAQAGLAETTTTMTMTMQRETRKRAEPSSELNWIHGFLAVGSERDAHDVALLKAEGVTHILNVTDNPVLPEAARAFTTLQVQMRDTLKENLLARLQSALEFIHSARLSGGRILVHCFAGVSRSVSVTIAYFMWANHLSLQAAMELVREHRECASPNLNFIGQLMMFEQTLTRASSAASTPENSDWAARPGADPLCLVAVCRSALHTFSEILATQA